jgi:hypothetical protein
VFLEVWFRNAEESKRRAADPNAFVLALARAKNDHEVPPVFDSFVGIFRVIPTGTPLSENSFETKVLERVRARNLAVL